MQREKPPEWREKQKGSRGIRRGQRYRLVFQFPIRELNQSGKGKVWFAGRGTAPEWQMKREMLSQCYTTKWRDIPLARLG
ncbi:DUF4113 domain-containing protein [Salmonella enterica]|nr:DUF4113 domain-containing protein [Salmonella enterica]EIH15648.1 putative DNA polymerase V subunit UmuC [Escherichia coli 97.0259]